MQSRHIEFETNGLTLRGDLFEPTSDQKNIACLFLHGWTGRPNIRAAERTANVGYYALTFSFPGHNNSEGDITKLTRKEALESAVAAYDLFKSSIPEGTEIVAIGNSFGGYIAPLLTTQRKVRALSIRVPADYPDDKFDLPQMGQGHDDPEVLRWRHRLHESSETMALRAVHEFTGELQIIEAKLDDLVPHETVHSYANAFADPEKLEYHLMEDWPHSLSDDETRNDQFQELLLTWLSRL